jgi:hypothetical protein
MVLRLIDDKVGSRLITGDEGVMDQLYNLYGISTTPAEKAVRPGIEYCRKWLEKQQPGNIPKFRVFNTLHNFINERSKYRIRDDRRVKKDANDPIDQPIKRKDHLMDCWRYIAMAQPEYKDRQLIPEFSDRQERLFRDRNRDTRKRKTEEYVDEFLGTEI